MSPLKGCTFGMRLKDNIPKPACTPGPLDYSTSCLTRFGKLSSPVYTMRTIGHISKRIPTTPGPPDYQSLNLPEQKTGKSYSFGLADRTVFNVKSDTPSPNNYTVPTTIGNNVPHKKKTGRSYSMSGRRKETKDKTMTPGPGAYETVSVDVYKKKGPAVRFTGGPRPVFVPADPHLPGPSQYNTLGCRIDKVKGTCAPRAPFGIRHSPKKFTVFTQADIMF